MFAADDLDALAHGVNVVGVMGGIAGMFANKYPDMKNHYQEICKQGKLNPGQILPWKEEGKPAVYNLATQKNPGADAQYDLVDKTVKQMLKHAESNGIKTIGIPQIGCGIGGLGWRRVRRIIKTHAEKSPVNLIAYTYEPPTKKETWYER
jgi:O-acetyl-ADP-ribose deacetylase (regulator of RNase III)